jgi:hypothetical protein
MDLSGEPPPPNLHTSMDTGMRPCERHITEHDSNGRSVFASAPNLLFYDRGGYGVSWAYSTNGFPANLNNNQDLEAYATDDPNSPISHIRTGSKIFLPNGLLFTITEYQPGASTIMHRTTTLDLVAVIEGEFELELDSGETRLLKAGVSVSYLE